MNLRNCIPTLIAVLLVATLAASSSAVPINQWSNRFGDGNAQAARDVAFDGSGNVYVTGYMQGTADFGGGPISSAGSGDVFLAKYDSAGSHIWSKRFGAADHQEAFGVATDAAGNAVIVGRFQTSINFGGPTHVSAGDFDMFLAKFDPAGTLVWSKRFGNGFINEGRGVAVDGAGNVVLVGFSAGATDFGGGALPNGGAYDVSVAKYDATGAHLWSKLMGTTLDQQGIGAGVDAAGNVLVVGYFMGSLDLGGGAMASAGGLDAFVGKFDAGGTFQWSKRFGDGSDQKALLVGADAAGNVTVAGYHVGSIDFGGGPIASVGATDLFAAQLSGTGAHNWSGGYGSSGTDELTGLAVHSTGNVYLTGYASGSINFGGGPLAHAGAEDVVLARLSPSGAHVWSSSYGSGGYQSGFGADVNSAGAVAIGGQFSGTLNFGSGVMTDAGGTDGCVAYFDDSAPVPVAFQDFRANMREIGVEVSWRLWSDVEMESFTLYRREGHTPALRLATGAIDAANGSFVDRTVEPATTYHYELVVREATGDEFRSPVVTITTPGALAVLGQNHPNPFNPATSIEYSLNQRSPVVLEIFDAVGTRVASLDQGVRDAGKHRLVWDGRDISGRVVGSGVYFYRIAGLPEAGTGKMVLLK